MEEKRPTGPNADVASMEEKGPTGSNAGAASMEEKRPTGPNAGATKAEGLIDYRRGFEPPVKQALTKALKGRQNTAAKWSFAPSGLFSPALFAGVNTPVCGLIAPSGLCGFQGFVAGLFALLIVELFLHYLSKHPSLWEGLGRLFKHFAWQLSRTAA